MSVIVAPSVLAADWGRLHEHILQVQQAGADWLHLDVMDGHLVDNISFGPAFCETVAKVAAVPLDVHLMIERPDHYWARFAKFARNITIHVEAQCDVAATLAAIRAAGCTAGISLKPGTPYAALEPYLDHVDVVLIMTVEPGFGGQAFMSEMLEKVRAAHAHRRAHGRDFRLEVDGGVNAATGRASREAGADTLVAGSSVFGAKDLRNAILELRG